MTSKSIFVPDQQGMFEIEANVFDMVENIAEKVVDGAKAKAPVLTGALRDSIEIVDKNWTDKTITVATQCGYGGYVELGHMRRGGKGHRIEGQPFLRPAVDEIMNGI